MLYYLINNKHFLVKNHSFYKKSYRLSQASNSHNKYITNIKHKYIKVKWQFYYILIYKHQIDVILSFIIKHLQCYII
jgi:hypothetical protein